MEQLRQSYKTDEAAEVPLGNETLPRIKLPDGYERRSPVQPYVEGPGYRKKRIRRIIIICVVAAVLVAAVIILWKFVLHK